MFSNIKNIVKKIGFTAAALALAAGIASAPAASASDLSPSNSPVPVVEQQAGILQVLVGFPTASTQQATVSVYSVSGDVYYSAVTGPNGEVSLKVPAGAYTVRIAAKGYQTVTQEVKIASGETTLVKVALSPVLSSRLAVSR